MGINGQNTTKNMIFSVTYHLQLRNVVSIYSTSHILFANVKLVVWTLWNIDNFTWLKKIPIV